MELSVINYQQSYDQTMQVYQDYADQAKHYYTHCRAKSTLEGYASDLKQYQRFIRSNQLEGFENTIETVAMYLVYLANRYKVNTVTRHVAALTYHFKAMEVNNPCDDIKIKRLLEGIKRDKGINARQVKPLMTNDLLKIIYAMPEGQLKTSRDKALLLVGFAGAFRRSELAALNINDIEFTEEGVRIILRKSKTDQFGEGKTKGIAYGNNPISCPVLALKKWIEEADLKEGALFYSIDRHGNLQKRIKPQGISVVVKEHVERAGYDPDDYSGHSLRAGFATQASKNGASDHQIKEQGGWKSSVYHQYIRSGQLFQDNASNKLGL
jgi:site-specific recombinase XerD